MNKKVKTVIAFAAFALLLIIAVAGYRLLSANDVPQQENSQSLVQSSKTYAPDFTVQDLNGKDVKFSDFKGSPIVLNFWASWCSPCKSEMPDYEKIYEQYSKKGVKFMMVNMTDGGRETTGTAKQFLTDNNYTFPVYLDVNQDAANAYSITAIPVSAFIDKSGAIVVSHKGMLDEGTMKSYVEEILK